jgi:hypothetical protein
MSLIFKKNRFWKIDEEEKRDGGVGVEREGREVPKSNPRERKE